MSENQKKVWITGASSGIGKSTAEKFAKEGWKVAANALHYKPKQSLIVTSSNECTKNNATHSYNLRSRK